ncbi:MAG: PsiF family protein [Parasulfuritortus sp.]|jgi:spermidine/putrescine-binding protein|nr:PsiF family protein [Parasulfuritortus sp.]
MKMFTRLIATLLAVAVFAPISAQAGEQQDRMKGCAKQYHEQNIPKDQYRAFMSKCLKKDSGMTSAASATAKPATTAAAPAATTAKATQKDKMKDCNANAKTQNLKGAARKDFMKSCLSGAAPAPAK